MSFNDHGQNSVSSLLNLLKQGPPSLDQSQPPTAAFTSTHPTYTQRGTGGYDPYQPYSASKPISSVNPTQRQLDELLASLKQNNGSSSSVGNKSDSFEPYSSRSSLEKTPKRSFDHTSLKAVISSKEVDRKGSVEQGSVGVKRGQGWQVMSFTKALPIISELLEKEEFKRELRKMKAEQDGLERRLWAKQEKLKADLDRSHQAEKEVARISKKPIPAPKQAEWTREVDSALHQFYLSTVLPSLDGIAQKHAQRLEELGVPGLGGDGEDRKARVKKIMGVLQAGMED